MKRGSILFDEITFLHHKSNEKERRKRKKKIRMRKAEIFFDDEKYEYFFHSKVIGCN